MKKSFSFKPNEPLKKHCAYRIGGPAELFYELKNIEELPELISWAKKNKKPYFIFGSGANILFPDKCLKGLAIKNSAAKIQIKNAQIIADSGTKVSEILQKAQKYYITGLENLAGIPGTIGGAVFGNAGASGINIGDFVFKVEIFDPKIGIKKLKKSDLHFKYRDSIFKKHPSWIILRIHLQLKKNKKVPDLAEIIKKRWEKQPKGFSCGSFFKNPSPKNPAGFLIEKCGLKGKKIGGAQISEKHGNFILNLGNATAKDILRLAALAKKKVLLKFGFKLEEEVRIVK